MANRANQKSIVDISSLVQLENNPAIDDRSKQKIESMLACTRHSILEQAEYLLQKKQRELAKKRKLKELEDHYELERSLKLKKIENKFSKSELVRDQNYKNFTSKVKKNSEHYKSIITKIHHQNEQSIEKQLQQRKQFDHIDNKDSKSLNNTRSQKMRKAHNQSDLLNRNLNRSNVDSQMSKIDEKISRAQTNHYLQQQLIIERAKSQAQQVQEAKKKAILHSQMIEDQSLRNYYQKIHEQYNCHNQRKQQTEKHCQDRKKSMEERMKKCQDNLRNLEQKKSEKLDELLRQKLERKYIPKTWKNQKAEIYKQKFNQNSKRLQQLKYEKGGQIMKKHVEITTKNKTIKDKKDKIYKAIMIN